MMALENLTKAYISPLKRYISPILNICKFTNIVSFGFVVIFVKLDPIILWGANFFFQSPSKDTVNSALNVYLKITKTMDNLLRFFEELLNRVLEAFKIRPIIIPRHLLLRS